MKFTATWVGICAATALTTSLGCADDHLGQSIHSSIPNPALAKAESQEFFQASRIVGRTAQDPEGRTMGDIKELVFNKQGDVLALVDVGNGRWAAVPWRLVNAGSTKGNGNVIFNTTAPAVRAAPVVSQDQWAVLSNPNFTQGIYTYYHLEPPIAAGGASSPGGSLER